MQCRGWEFHELHCDSAVNASHGPGPAPLGDSPEAQAGARGTEEGTGGKSKEEEKEGQPSPFSGKIPGAIVHFSTFCTARPSQRIAARAASH